MATINGSELHITSDAPGDAKLVRYTTGTAYTIGSMGTTTDIAIESDEPTPETADTLPWYSGTYPQSAVKIAVIVFRCTWMRKGLSCEQTHSENV